MLLSVYELVNGHSFIISSLFLFSSYINGRSWSEIDQFKQKNMEAEPRLERQTSKSK